MITKRSPLEGLDWSFTTYLNNRLSEKSIHITGDDVPDYAYGMDYELRKKLDAIPGLHSLASKYQVSVNSYFMQYLNRSGIAVGPNQFPDVYDITCDCARRLGISIPNVFIVNDSSMNASTMCADDTQPVIMLHSGLYERVTPGELKSVIGHECGHIQNNHHIYQSLIEDLVVNGANGILKFCPQLLDILSFGVTALLNTWSRAAEVTCDRAGMICCDDINDAYTIEAKLMYGAAFGKEQKIDFKALEEQLKDQMSNIVKYEEVILTHPSSVRRIMAVKEFAECEVLYSWRPDLKKPDSILRSKKECDERCRMYISLSSEKGVE